MPLSLPELPYAPDALEPHISALTVQQVHGQHERACIEAVAGAIAGTELETLPLEQLARTTSGRLAEQAGQAWNLQFFWTCLSPRGGGEPGGRLGEWLGRHYGDHARFREEFNRLALSLFGSGWIWLVQRPDGSPGIVLTYRASSPITGADLPLLACNLWEHAYYLDRHNARADYLEAFWKLVDWNAAGARLR
jgi:Fe-Mn family superoxide dismutase